MFFNIALNLITLLYSLITLHSKKLGEKKIMFLPILAMYILVSSLQDHVGTDYESYLDILENHDFIESYFDKGEYLFSLILWVISKLNLPDQSLFIFFSALNLYLVYWISLSISRNNFISTFYFIILITGFYFWQMNALRQSFATLILIASLIYFSNRNYIKSITLFSIATFMHAASYIYLIPFILAIFFRSKKTNLWYIFILSLPIYAFIGLYISQIVHALFPMYSFYIDNEYVRGDIDLIEFFSKFYYLPVYIYAIYLVEKNADYKYKIIFYIWVMTFFSILMVLIDGIFYRLNIFFAILNFLPISIVFKNIIEYKNIKYSYIFICYIFLPFLLKITFFARSEYIYKSILFH